MKSFLVPVAGPSAALAVDAALGLCAQVQGHVVGLHVRPSPIAAIPMMGEGMPAAVIEDLMAAAERLAEERAKAAKDLFDQSVARRGLPASAVEWIDRQGAEDEETVYHARLCDVTVLARPGDGLGYLHAATLNAVLMDSGRSLLLLPPDLLGTPGRRVAVAWNGSAEAARAVGLSMAVLARAESVTVLSAGEGGRHADAESLVKALSWHGIPAQARLLPVAGGEAGPALLAACEDISADLLVMGAYTHARLRQWVWGGVTHHVLHNAGLACLLSH